MTIAESLYLMGRHVMLRAFRDLTCKNGPNRREAIQFLTAATPDWQDSLETWCAFARLDPNMVIKRTQDFLEKGAFIAIA